MPTARTSSFFASRLFGFLRVPLIALIVLTVALGPLLSLPGTAGAAHPGGTHNQVTSNPTMQEVPGPENPIDYCSWSKLSFCLTGVVYTLFVQLTGLITYFGGVVFDFVAAMALEGGTYADALINKGWTIARDVANMAFIFLLIYLAFQLILNIEGVGVGKMLAKLIAVALLINFSFFFSRVVIDASNLLAHQFYDNIQGRQAAASAGNEIMVNGQPLKVKHISENIMSGLNVQQVISNNSFQKFYSQNGFLSNVAILICLFFMFGVINLILSFVFFTAAIQFLGRIISLWIAVILSPIGFISFIIPGLSKLSMSWWNGLIRNAFFAPAFLFFFYIIVLFLGNDLLGSSVGNALYSNTANQNGSVESFFRPLVTILIRLGIIVGLLMAALKVGEYFGQASAKSIMGGALRYSGAAAGVGLRAAGWAGRRGVGFIYDTGRGASREGVVSDYRDGQRQYQRYYNLDNRVGRAIPSSSAPGAVLNPSADRLRPNAQAAEQAAERNERRESARVTLERVDAQGQQQAPTTRANDVNVSAQNATLSAGQNLQVTSELRNVADSIRQASSTLQPSLKDVESKAATNQAQAKLTSVQDRLRDQHASDEKQRQDEDLDRQILRATLGTSSVDSTLQQIERSVKPSSQPTNRLAAERARAQANASAAAQTAGEQKPDTPTLQQEGDTSIAQVQKSEYQNQVESLEAGMERAAKRGSIDPNLMGPGSGQGSAAVNTQRPKPQDSGSAATVDTAKPKPQDSGNAEKASA